MPISGMDDAAFRHELLKLPYDKRWNLLKPKLEFLYHTTEVPQICRILEDRWGFKATPQQCKYRFKSWRCKKSVPEKVKQAVCTKALKRAAQGKETVALYHGHSVPLGRLRRTLEATPYCQPSTTMMFSLPAHQYEVLGGYVPFGNSLLINWNMPYGSQPTDPTFVWTHGSPSSSIQTPDHVEIRTPGSLIGAPAQVTDTLQTQASLTPVVLQARSRMMVEGRLQDLLRTLSQTEQMTLSTWLYQFWYFAFVSAQSWGKDPMQWTNQRLNFDRYNLTTLNSTANTPNESLTPRARSNLVQQPLPTQHCRWTTHVNPDAYYHGSGEEENGDQNMADQNHQPFSHHLHEGLQSNEFSNVSEDRLPLPVPNVVRQAIRDPHQFALESAAFAIMGRNLDLLWEILRVNPGRPDVDIAPIYPFHMAAAFLDGGNTCCLVFDALCNGIRGIAVTKERFTNEYGHTVLDGFLLTILRSHTMANMKDVDGDLTNTATMPGQEVDICGRWSADSPCFRAFVASGQTALPASWKHKFCHTSAQAIVHSTSRLILEFPTMQYIPSGLFKNQCFKCGLRLQLGPLHALVMTAFCLATTGRPEEDLFGIVACYLCMVSVGVSPLSRRAISPPQLLGKRFDIACSHEELTPYEMAVAIEAEVQQYKFSEQVQVGWNVFTTIMRLTEEARVTGEEARSIHSCDVDWDALDRNVWTGDYESEVHNRQFPSDCGNCRCAHLLKGRETPHFADSPVLGHVWAAVQAELANHRKVTEGDGWLSESFSMQALLESLSQKDNPNIGYVRRSILKPYCRCGIFRESAFGIAHRESMFEEHCANLDGSAEAWARSTFIEMPEEVY